MRKSFVAILAVALVAALAAPAVAGPVDLTGFVRIRPYMTNFVTGTGYPDDAHSRSFVDERVRLKLTAGDENVKAVTFFEFDQTWGDSAYTVGRGVGGGLEADTNNLELKNAFLWFKVPNTSFDVTAGVQNQSDAYAGVFFGVADMAGVFAKGMVAEGVSTRLAWSKFWESQTDDADDVDLYLAEVAFAPTKQLNVGASLYFINDGSDGTIEPTSANVATQLGGRGPASSELGGATYDGLKLYMPGVNASFDAGAAKLSAFLLYQFGTASDVPTVGDVDLAGFAADVRADFAAGKGKGFVELLYASGDDGSDDTYDAFLTCSNYNAAAAYFARTDMFILMPNADDINLVRSIAPSVNNGGLGTLHAAAGFSMPLTDKVSAKFGLGYLMTNEDNAAGESSQGTEINTFLNYNIAKGLDLGLVGAYAFAGDALGTDVDDLYDVHGRLNFAF